MTSTLHIIGQHATSKGTCLVPGMYEWEHVHTREQWLKDFGQAITPRFREAGHTPQQWRVGVGRCSGRGGAKSQAIGLCYTDLCSEDGTREITLDLSLDQPLRVADVMTHELCHAALPWGVGHKKPFKDLARKMDLEGKPTATYGGEAFARYAQPIIDQLGRYPHKAMVVTQAKKQTTRMVKMECQDCGYIARTSTKNLDEHGPVICPCNHEPMEIS